MMPCADKHISSNDNKLSFWFLNSICCLLRKKGATCAEVIIHFNFLSKCMDSQCLAFSRCPFQRLTSCLLGSITKE